MAFAQAQLAVPQLPRHPRTELVAFYVAEHNSKIPHSAFRGQTPNEIYYGTGDHVPQTLAAARAAARAERRARSCAVCTA